MTGLFQVPFIFKDRLHSRTVYFTDRLPQQSINIYLYFQLEINKQVFRVLLNSVAIIGFCGNVAKDVVWHAKRNLKKTDLIFPRHQIQNKHIGKVAIPS